MEINGEVNIEIDQYADVSIEIDTEQLAEELAINHNFVDDVVLHNYVDERMDDYELKVQVDDLSTEVDELREKIRKIEPDTDNYSFVRYHMLDNYVRVNDLRDVIDAQVNLRLTRILSDVINGIQEYKKESDA
tara:strand:+ start:339 stop:737 length:399 start_codon:yes stop_codon:yes gene_type:complete